jgi:hypothetical protein
MRVIPRLSQLFGHTTLAVLLAVAVVALPVASVVACPVEEFDTDDSDTDATREVELAAPSENQTTPAPARVAIRVSPGSRPTGGLIAHPDRKSPLSPFDRPLGSRLRR